MADPTDAGMAAERFARYRADAEVARPAPPTATAPAIPEGRTSIGWSASWSAMANGVRQWAVLCRRNLDVLTHNRLTLAIMLGAPALVVAMFALLFQSDAFDAGQPRAVAAVSITYWLAFAAFFFGLTYGLLQIVTEAAILRRERLVNLGVIPYLLAKVTVLVPVLLGVNVAMLAVLRATGRLPEGDTELYVALTVTLLIDAVVALILGLLASAAVTDPSHATLALPLLCFPAVLFSGAVLPVDAMAGVGRAISLVTSDRWAFEALGRQLGIEGLLAHDGSGHGQQLLAEHGGSFSGGAMGPLVAMVLFGIVFLAGTHLRDRAAHDALSGSETAHDAFEGRRLGDVEGEALGTRRRGELPGQAQTGVAGLGVEHHQTGAGPAQASHRLACRRHRVGFAHGGATVRDDHDGAGDRPVGSWTPRPPCAAASSPAARGVAPPVRSSARRARATSIDPVGRSTTSASRPWKVISATLPRRR